MYRACAQIWVHVCACVCCVRVCTHACCPAAYKSPMWGLAALLFPMSQMWWGLCSGPTLPSKGKSINREATSHGRWEYVAVLDPWSSLVCPSPSLYCRPLDLGAPAIMLQFYPMIRSPICKRPWAPRPARPACLPASRVPESWHSSGLININPFNHCSGCHK